MKVVLVGEPAIEGFGPVRQMGHVVSDIEACMATLSREQRLGPWLLMRNVHLPCSYRGEKSEPVIHVALTYHGDMQIELIQQVNDASSPYFEVTRAGDFGLHHTAHLCRDIDRDTERALAQGFELVCDIRMMGARYVYLQSAAADKVDYVELLPDNLLMRSMFRQGMAACRRWKGNAGPIIVDLNHAGTILGSLPGAASAWVRQLAG